MNIDWLIEDCYWWPIGSRTTCFRLVAKSMTLDAIMQSVSKHLRFRSQPPKFKWRYRPTHTISDEDVSCSPMTASSFAGQLSADDRNRIGDVSRKALPRVVTHTAFDIEEIIDSANRKLFTRITQPGHCLHHLLPLPKPLPIVSRKDNFLTNSLSSSSHSIQKQFYQSMFLSIQMID